MAKRPFFIPALNKEEPVKTNSVEFTWFSGFAKSQKQKSISSFHENISKEFKLDKILEISKKYANALNFLYLGRGYQFPVALEGALKLKEISYLNACAYPAAELKHGPIALINPQLATIAMCGNIQTFEKILSNLKEVEARGGKILAFAPKGIHSFVKAMPLWIKTKLFQKTLIFKMNLKHHLYSRKQKTN